MGTLRGVGPKNIRNESRESEFLGRHFRVARKITDLPAERSARVASLKIQRQSIIIFLDKTPRSGVLMSRIASRIP